MVLLKEVSFITIPPPQRSLTRVEGELIHITYKSPPNTDNVIQKQSQHSSQKSPIAKGLCVVACRRFPISVYQLLTLG